MRPFAPQTYPQRKRSTSLRMTEPRVRPRLVFCGRNSDDGFRATDIFEPVVGSHGNRVFARAKSAEGDLVTFFGRIADAAGWGHQDPNTTVDAVLRALDAAPRILRGELDYGDLPVRHRGIRSPRDFHYRRSI